MVEAETSQGGTDKRKIVLPEERGTSRRVLSCWSRLCNAANGVEGKNERDSSCEKVTPGLEQTIK
jgi:hypothetical protein